MAGPYTIAAGAIAKHDFALVASTVETVTFTDNVTAVEIISDGTAKVYYTVDGSTPTVGGANCYMIPASLSVDERAMPQQGTDAVKLISSGTPTLSIQRLA